MHTEPSYVLIPRSFVTDFIRSSHASTTGVFLSLCAMIPSPAEPYAQTSISQLVTLTGLTPRTVFSALKALEAEGRIARSRESLSVSNTYEILSWQPTSSPEQQEAAVLANSCLPEQVQPDTPAETEMELLLHLVADTYKPMDNIDDLIAWTRGDLSCCGIA